ncbi:MFS toxin efflux pump [Coniochaeta ligniaria NRRL 30616]|uniref:MFS toxin efflux pump n=1 Tax=Coniochaeta ligniaria NRRL 30616 TaxID=1408157 RepID=A0A1J7IX14_9PEZI|nr:MFS toxin efflux pump [Coniochaeta ligniaria NRRL 30616]
MPPAAQDGRAKTGPHPTDENGIAVSDAKPETAKADSPEPDYPTGVKLALLMTSIFVGMFLVSLDRLIVSTAIPQITNEFNSAGDIGWYGTAYLLTMCAFQLAFGKIYTVFSIKTVFLGSIILFEAGSAICGAAPNSIAFILGQAIAGVGSGGISSGIIVIITYAVPLQKRPKYQGFFGAVFGVSSTIGPLIGGAFTTNVTWRWCFYINLPLGAVEALPMKEKIQQLNVLGLLALFPGVVCLCLALQWGGTTYAWSEGRIIALLVLAFVLLVVFGLIQVWKPTTATVPPRILVQRSVASGFLVACCLGSHMMLIIYYLPVWFQAINGDSPLDSGIHLLPMVIPLVIASIFTGQLVSKIGYYTPFCILGVSLTAVGAGLFTIFQGTGTPTGYWIGFQIIYGFGLGTCTQAPNMAAQTVLPREDVAIGASLMFFGQQLFGAVFTTVGQNVLDNQLAARLAGIPGVDPGQIQGSGVTELFKHIPPQYHTVALDAYNDSLRRVFEVGLVMACLSVPASLAMEWRSVKSKGQPGGKTDGVAAAEKGEKTADGEKKDTTA